jgi:hypothetical protein
MSATGTTVSPCVEYRPIGHRHGGDQLECFLDSPNGPKYDRSDIFEFHAEFFGDHEFVFDHEDAAVTQRGFIAAMGPERR